MDLDARRAAFFDSPRPVDLLARRCRIPAFVALKRRIVEHRPAIDAALEHDLSQGLIESTNTKIRLLTRIGFKPPEALVALAMLSLGAHRPSLPGRSVR